MSKSKYNNGWYVSQAAYLKFGVDALIYVHTDGEWFDYDDRYVRKESELPNDLCQIQPIQK